jgi:transcriptional regulator with PAS, ATPase and Fis domain
MKIKALKFRSNPISRVPVQSSIEAGRAQDFENIKGGVLPAVYVVNRRDLEHLLNFKDLVVGLNKQGGSIELPRYLKHLRGDKIPLMEVKYKKGIKRFKNGIEAFLERALEQKVKNLFILGAEEKVFDGLWNEANSSEPEKMVPEASLEMNEVSKIRESCLNGTAGVTASLLLKLERKHGETPDELADKYVGNSEEAALVRCLIHVARKSDKPVLILGETGTGKEIIAGEIHPKIDKDKSKWVPFNCAGIPETLVESELFGHVKGIFTDATKDKEGLWKAADGGTLFLDEIGDLRLDQQAKILRAMEERKIRPVGATHEVSVNARIVAATNRDLFSMVQAETFREDLYFRLGGFFIRTPALRDHKDDIPLLAQHLWKKVSGDGPNKLPQVIVEELQQHDWPGNVRQLKMILNGLHDMFGTEDLTVADVKTIFYLSGENTTPREAPVSQGDINLHLAECLRHLKRVHEVVHGSEHAIRPAMEKIKWDEGALLSLQETMKFRYYELEKLCQKPLFFHHETTFSSVNGLKGKITYLMGLLEKDGQEAQRYWNAEVSQVFGTVTSAVFREIERVLTEA